MSAIPNIFLFMLFIMTSASFVESYRILGIFPYNGKSHNLMFSALKKGLAKRGHQVDDITHYPLKNPPKNYNVLINLNGTLPEVVNNITIDFVLNVLNDPVTLVATDLGNKICDLMNIEEFQKFIKHPPHDPPYDVVITEAFGSHCYMGFGHHLKIPVIALSSAAEYPWISDFVGNNDNLATVPNNLISEFDKTKFWDRLKNVLNYYWMIYRFRILTDEQTHLMRKYINPDIPDIREVEKSVALTLVNTDLVMYGPKPVAPSLVQVGGLHVEEYDTKLTPDLQKWLDESPDGVVYFSFGSLVLIETLPTTTLTDIFNSLSKISPVKVLIKLVDEKKLSLKLPKNVLTSSWIPQQAVLAHKNIRCFITHGGLMGSQEAFYHGVPIIGIPLFADQPRNVETFVTKSMGLKIDITNITSSSLDWALNEMLTNPKYRQNAIFHSKLFKDRPMTAMDTAIYWVEFVIRNGPHALKPPALSMSWWKLALLDVYGFLLLCLASVIALIFYFMKAIFKKYLSKSFKKTKVQ